VADLMTATEDDPVAFLDGHPLPSGGVCVLSALWGLDDVDDRPTRLLVIGRSESFSIDVPANLVDVTAFVTQGVELVVGLSRLDEAFVIDLSTRKFTREAIYQRGHSHPEGLIGLHCIGETVLAFGMFGQVYVRPQSGRWEPMGQGLYDPTPSVRSPMINAMVGSSFEELYCVGALGLISRYDGRHWDSIDSPTNVSLNQAALTEQGQVFACGDLGVLVRGSGDRWEAIDTGVAGGFWGIAAFLHRVFLSTLDGLWVFEDALGTTPIDMGLGPEITTYRLAADAKFLWSFGLGDVLRFDGQQWARHLPPP